jgi:uncharacterized membrane protein
LFWNPQARFNLIWSPYHFFLSLFFGQISFYLFTGTLKHFIWSFFFYLSSIKEYWASFTQTNPSRNLPSTSSYYATILFIKFIFKPERFLWIQVTTFYVRSQQHQLLKNHHHKKNLLHLLYESNKGKMKIEITLLVTTVPESKATCQLLYYQNLVF